jgi:hypothetical protein
LFKTDYAHVLRDLIGDEELSSATLEPALYDLVQEIEGKELKPAQY